MEHSLQPKLPLLPWELPPLRYKLPLLPWKLSIQWKLLRVSMELGWGSLHGGDDTA